MTYAIVEMDKPNSEYTKLLAASNALIADARHRIFFMLHDHHVLPHRYPESERKRRDGILLRRGWDAAPRYTWTDMAIASLTDGNPWNDPDLMERVERDNNIILTHTGPDDVVLTGQSSWQL